MTDKELTQAQIDTLFRLIDTLLLVLRDTDPKLALALVTNRTLNDFYLIQRGGK